MIAIVAEKRFPEPYATGGLDDLQVTPITSADSIEATVTRIYPRHSGIGTIGLPYTNERVEEIGIIHPRTEEEEEEMSISREELDARLAANRAEMESLVSSIRAEMALSRENTNVQFATLNSAINSISSKIDGQMGRVDGDIKAINGKFEGIQGQITGLSTAVNGIQSGISTKLAIFGVIIGVLVALPGIISALKDSPQPTQQQPIVIQIPHQQEAPSERNK